MMKTCGWCGLFKPHKSITGFSNGWNLQDGKCPYRKSTVIGDSCEHWEQKTKTIHITERDRKRLKIQQREKAKERDRKKEIQRIQFFSKF